MSFAIAGIYTAALIAFVVFAIKSSIRQFKSGFFVCEEDPTWRWSNYKIAVVSVAWVVGVKLVTMIMAHSAWGGGDMFENASDLWLNASDAPHYMDIAKFGYQSSGELGLFIVFLPLYPFLLGGAGALTGEYFWTGSILSMMFLAAAGYILYKWVRHEHGEKAAARSLKYFMLFPSIFFAMLPMTEGLFLLLAAAFLYCLSKRRMRTAALIGMFAAFTRSVGVVFVLPYIVAVLQNQKLDGRKLLSIDTAKRSLWALLIPFGTLGYLAINLSVFGDPLHFMDVQKSHWEQGFGLFFNLIAKILGEMEFADGTINGNLWIPTIAVIAFMLWRMCCSTKRQKPMYLAYSAAVFYFSMSVTWLLSGPRYSLALLPIFMDMGAAVTKKWADVLITILLAACLLAFSLAFARGGPIY